MFGHDWEKGTGTIVLAENEVWGNLGTHPLSNFAVGSTYQVEYDAGRGKIRWDKSDPKIQARISGKEYAELQDKVREARAGASKLPDQDRGAGRRAL